MTIDDWNDDTRRFFLYHRGMFSKKRIYQLQEIMKALGLKLDESEIHDAAVAVVRFVCAKERRADSTHSS